MVTARADTRTLQHLSARMQDACVDLARQWLDRLQEVVTVHRLDVFPSHQLLDHIPQVIGAIAAHIRGDGAAIETNEEVIRRAAELGELRHVQHASVHQLLREYRVLADLLEEFVGREVGRMDDPDAAAVAQAMRRLGEAVRILQQHTVDTFVANYTQMIERQTTQLRTFSRLVSHEIRQPLAVLQVIARALPVREDDLEAARMLEIFDRSVLRLGEVTGKLERLARVTQATDLSPSERAVDLTEVAHTAAGQLTDAAAGRGVEVIIHPNLPTVRMDPARAELVLLNLLANAIKFSDPAKRRPEVEVSRGAGDEPSVIIRDNGVGMSPPRLQTVFREFVRAHSQRDDDVRAWGLGLGLSIVRECMDHANGSVRVDSIEGRGTTFRLTWPKAEPKR